MKWKPRKVTPELAEEMRRLKAQGLSYVAIAKRFGVYPSTVQYHVNQKYRLNALRRAKERYKQHPRIQKLRTPEDRQRQREYWRMYRYNRYHTDEEFRRRVIEHSKRYQQKKRNANKG